MHILTGRLPTLVVERLPALHYSVDFVFLSFGIMGFIVELKNYLRVIDEA